MIYVFLAVLSLVATLFLFRLLSAAARRRNRPTVSEVADKISRHADGTEGPYDWDEFTSVPIADRRLDAAVRRCIQLDSIVLPEQRGRELKKIADELRRRTRS
jgi:hypothetical protein